MPPRRTNSSAPPSSAHFAKVGIPFLLFMVLGTWGYSKLLAPAYDRAGSQLYGKSEIDHSAGKTKKKRTGGDDEEASSAPAEKAEPKKLPSLSEEYAKVQKSFETDYINKRVPRPAGADPRSH